MSRPRLAPALPVALALGLAGCSDPPAPTPVTLSPDAGRTVVVGQNGMPRFVTPGAPAGEAAPGAQADARSTGSQS